MAKAILKGRLLRWGHTKGIRLPTKEADRLEIPVGTAVRVTVEPDTTHTLADVPSFRDPQRGPLDHDRVFAEGWLRRRGR